MIMPKIGATKADKAEGSSIEKLAAPPRTAAIKSVYRGVCWSKLRKKWRADIRINGKKIYLGLFDKEIDASSAYQERSGKLDA